MAFLSFSYSFGCSNASWGFGGNSGWGHGGFGSNSSGWGSGRIWDRDDRDDEQDDHDNDDENDNGWGNWGRWGESRWGRHHDRDEDEDDSAQTDPDDDGDKDFLNAEPTSFTLDGDIPVDVDVSPWEDGALLVKLSVSEDAEEVADISGVAFGIEADNVWLYSGQGDPVEVEGFDGALTFDPASDDQPVEEVMFIVGADDQTLTAEAFSGETITVSMINVGDLDGDRDGTSVTSDQAPEIVDESNPDDGDEDDGSILDWLIGHHQSHGHHGSDDDNGHHDNDDDDDDGHGFC